MISNVIGKQYVRKLDCAPLHMHALENPMGKIYGSTVAMFNQTERDIAYEWPHQLLATQKVVDDPSDSAYSFSNDVFVSISNTRYYSSLEFIGMEAEHGLS